MDDAQYLTGRFLLAMPGMFDPRFARSVNLMCQHDSDGAMGLDLGHLREGVRLHAILRELEIDPGKAPDCEVLHGGPVEPGRGFVLHSTDWAGPDTVQVAPVCALTSSLGVLRAIAEGRGPSRWLIALGYAGWGPGQLESEMQRHGWYVAQGLAEVLFDTGVTARWMATWRAEGIDPAQLSPEMGRA
jgi:putative transcriptional regulator